MVYLFFLNDDCNTVLVFWVYVGDWNWAWHQCWVLCIPAQLPQLLFSPSLSLCPQPGWLANKSIYLVSMWAAAPTMHTHPHSQSCRLKKTKACFPGMAVMQSKLKMKQGRNIKLKCSHCASDCDSQFSDCDSQFSSKSLQGLWQM